jgi:hypothetical protein
MPVPTMALRTLAHSRTGDKGDTSNISLIAYDPAHFAHLCQHVSAARVKAHFAARCGAMNCRNWAR